MLGSNLDLNLPKTADALVDETGKVLIPQLQPIIKVAVQELMTGLQSLLVGRVVTITIK